MGGGVHCQSLSSPLFVGCRFLDNVADDGGAISSVDMTAPHFDSCIFRGNISEGERGGAFYCYASGATFSDCVFEGNQTTGSGGVVWCTALPAPTFERCEFTGNAGRHGGVAHITTYGNAVFDGCTFAGNAATLFGGALNCESGAPVLHNCTIADNEAPYGAGLACHTGATPEIANSIIAFNGAGEAVFSNQPENVPLLACTDIYGNAGGDWTEHIADQQHQDGNLSEDPLFCRNENPQRPYSLSSLSICAEENQPLCGQIGAWAVGCGPGGVVISDQHRPNSIEILRVWPNPIRQALNVTFEVPPACATMGVRLTVQDLLGRVIADRAMGAMAPGIHTASWTDAASHCARVPNGIYVLSAVSPFGSDSRLFVRLR